MASRPWPGNVRELQNMVRRLTGFCVKDRIDMDLVRLVAGSAPASGSNRVTAPSGSESMMAYKMAKARVVDGFTLDYVRDLLGRTGGNVSEAARVSGLSRVALMKILARLGEQAASFRTGTPNRSLRTSDQE